MSDVPAAAARAPKATTQHAEGRAASAEPGGRIRHAKLAVSVAQRIIADIAARGWPEGDVIGSEPELLERYGVSRAVFREAVRLVEHQQVARMRRGPGGGLVVTSPTLEAVIDPVAVYLFFANARVGHVAEARMALEDTVAELAPARLSEDDIQALRGLAERERRGDVADHRELHARLAVITKNPALDVFVSLLNRLTYLYFPDATRVKRAALAVSAHAHVAIIDAVLAGNAGLARHRMRTHLEAEAAYLRRHVLPAQPLDASVLRSIGTGDKRGERVAREIFLEVTGAGWPVGAMLGSEAELMDRFDVSRAVLREAVRLLEHHQIATMRRGPGGGLFVLQPGIESACDAIALLLERRGIRPSDLFELRRAVELAIVDLAVKRLDEDRSGLLLEALAEERLASEEEFPAVGHDLHVVLAGIVDNPVLELISLVLIRLTWLHQAAPPDMSRIPTEDVIRVHSAIVEALLDRDVELTRHRMRRHLEALAAWVR